MNAAPGGRRQQTYRHPTTTASGSYTRPNYFGREANDGYRVINQDKSKSRTKLIANNDRSRPKSTEKGRPSAFQNSSTEIVRMRRELEQLGPPISSGPSYYQSEVQFSKKAAKHFPSNTDRTPVSSSNQLANVSPIFTKKRQGENELNLNDKLDVLIRRLDEIKHSEYLSPPVDTSQLERKNLMNTSLKQQRHSSRSINSKKHLEESYNESVSFNLSRKPAKSIFLMSNLSHESSRADGLLDASGRTNQTSQRLGIPTSRQTNKTGTYSMQYYLLKEKLQRANKDIEFGQIFSVKPHRSRITSVVQHPITSEIYSTSLDYSVAITEPDGQSFRTLYKHRGGVECSLLVDGMLVSGGRDCYLRSADWSKKVEGVPTQLVKLRDRLAVRAGNLYEFDAQTLQIDEKCYLQPQTSLLCSDHIPNSCLIGGKSTLSLYDSRRGRPQQLLALNDNINCWKIHKQRIIAVGKNLWVGNHNRMELKYAIPEDYQISSIAEYYDSLLLCPRLSSDAVLIYEESLNMLGKVRHPYQQLSVFGLKNRLVCGYSDGIMQFCILR